MNEELIQIFAECIEAIEEGRLTVDDCLDNYPQYRAELIDLLYVALQARAVPGVYATAEFRQGARARLLSQLPPRGTAANGAVNHHHFLASAAIPQLRQSTGQRAAERWPELLRRGLSTLASSARALSQEQAVAIGAVLLLVCLFFIGGRLRDGRPAGGETELAEDSPPVQTERVTPENEVEVVAPEMPPASEAVAEESQGEETTAAPATR